MSRRVAEIHGCATDEELVKAGVKTKMSDWSDPRVLEIAERLRRISSTNTGNFKTHEGLAAWFISIERRTTKPIEQLLYDWERSEQRRNKNRPQSGCATALRVIKSAT